MPKDPKPPAEDIERHLQKVWDRAYAAETNEDLAALYADWAEYYDRDHEYIGFVGHERAADVLRRHLTCDRAAILDAGAGTGAAGVALARRGFRHLTAIDLSAAMLQQAAAKGVYDHLHELDLGEPLDRFFADTFDAAILVGVFSYGQAPAHALEEIVRVVRPGGPIVFTMRTDFFEEDAMGVRSKLEQLEREGAWRPLELTEPALYLPRKDPTAEYRVWCYEALPGKRAQPSPEFVHEAKLALTSDASVKRIDHRHIWNRIGSRKYEEYIQRPEYYLTEHEEEILQSEADELAADERVFVELGCGSARKIKHVLRAAVEQSPGLTYVPIDVSREAIEATASEVAEEFGGEVELHPLRGPFQETLAQIPADEAKTMFFFGSSIGNLDTIDRTVAFLQALRQRMQPRDRLVVGTDLHKDPEVIEAAYNAGEENRSFFVNMVRRLNDVLGARFDLSAFRLASTYAPEEVADPKIHTGIVDLRLQTVRAQETYVPALGVRVRLDAGEAISVGKSRKFRPTDVARIAQRAGMKLRRQWFDADRWFSLNELVPSAG